MQSGTDVNGDLIFNDRPAGFARNTLLTDPTWNLNLFAGYSFTFGPGAGGTLTVTTVTRPEQGRYRMGLNVFVNNLTNRTNLMNYNGTVSSPLFGRATMAQGARRIQASMNLQF